MYGHPTLDLDFNLTAQEDNGYGLMNTIGCGFLIIPGAGLPSIMVVGFTMPITGGCGCRVMNGHPHGYHGAAVVIIMGGLRCDPALV